MKPPRIQYATTSDGVSIAFWSAGEGTPLIYLSGPPLSHIQQEWQQPSYSRWHTWMAANRRLIRFDSRGSGLSERRVSDFSLDALALDIDAVADKLQLESFVLIGVLAGGMVSMRYALTRPERVSHLVLWNAYPGGRYLTEVPAARAFMSMMENDWELFTESLSHFIFGWSSGGPAREFASFLRECVSQEICAEFFRQLAETDITGELGDIRQPTLVLQHRSLAFPNMDTTRLLASRIPDARLALLDGTWLDPGDDVDTISRAFDEMLRDRPMAAPAAPAAAGQSTGAVHTILWTDVEGSTSLTQRLGDAAAREVMREHERITREALKAHGGSEVKTMGDGFMASFGSATKALECSIAMQKAFAAPEPTVGAQGLAPLRPETPIRVRIGLNAGEPIAEDDPDGRSDLFGTAVIVAARIAAQANGGEILVSNVVRELVAGKGFLFSDRGDHALKGFEDPVRVYEVRWQEAS